MLAITGTEIGARRAATDFIAVTAALAALVVPVAAMVPAGWNARWRAGAARMWSYGVYYVGYRLLSVQVSCGSWAVSAVPLVAKHA